MNKDELPKISVVIPTYNSEPRLERCLKLIRETNYSEEKLEILVIDGGSQDKTIEIAKKYNCKILHNERRLSEPGKGIGIANATGEIVCFIDDDNYIDDKDFFKKMAEPFAESEIIAAEPWAFSIHKDLTTLERYWAYMGINDPVCYYMKSYDRFNILTKKWTGLSLVQQDKGGYIKFNLNKKNIPTIGANGFAARTEIIRKTNYMDLLDLDKVAQMVELGYTTFAKVKCGLIHTYTPNLKIYIKKAIRKARSFYGDVTYSGQTAKEKTKRLYKYPNFLQGIIKFSLATILIFPLLITSLRLYIKTKDFKASFIHIPVCWITFVIYVLKFLRFL